MAVTGYTKRRVNIYSLSSTTPDGAGPYEEVLEALAKNAPFEAIGAFERTIRINHVEQSNGVWFVELYLILNNRLEILEVSADPDSKDQPSFVVPGNKKSFAARTCAIFDPDRKICAMEYVRNGPKLIDFVEILSEKALSITGKKGSQFALTPIIEENFLHEIDHFERIRQVKVVFERPNPGWGDIGVLSDELEGSGDAKREVVLTASRSGTIQKNVGLLAYVKSLFRSRSGASTISNIVISGRRPGDAGETQVSSEKSVAKHIASLPITDQEEVYRRTFISVAAPFLNSQNPEGN